MDPVNELHVMRKQYLDGSIPAGFQRTAMCRPRRHDPVQGQRPRRRSPPPHPAALPRGRFLPRGERPRSPHHVSHRPARDPAHRSGDRARAPLAAGTAGGRPARRRHHARLSPGATRARGGPPGRQRLHRRRKAGGDQGGLAPSRTAPPRAQRSLPPAQPVADPRGDPSARSRRADARRAGRRPGPRGHAARPGRDDAPAQERLRAAARRGRRRRPGLRGAAPRLRRAARPPHPARGQLRLGTRRPPSG